MVCDGGVVARRIAWRTVYCADQFYRALWTGAGCGVSFGACGGVVCGARGYVAAPAMVVLGDAAAGVVHVRFYGLGALSLCSGYFWRDRYGDAGLCDWEKDYENARAAKWKSVESQNTCAFGGPSVSFARLLEVRSSEHRHECLCYLGNLEEKRFVPYGAD